MPVSLTYTGNQQFIEIAEATRQAHGVLQSPELIALVQQHEGPFDDSVPATLPPADVAAYLRDENLAMTVINYQDPKGRTSIGGRFRYSQPTVIEINTLALPQRESCDFAAVLIHESVHALSYHIKRREGGRISFTHTPNGRAGNENTAPYWIQTQVQGQLCGQRMMPVEELEVEIIEDEAVA